VTVVREVDPTAAAIALSKEPLAWVFLPVDHDAGALRDVVKGSGIVALRPRHGSKTVPVWFEGAIFGQAGMERFVDRVRHAYFRMREDYPTRAKAIVPVADVVKVGVYMPGAGVLLGRLDAEDRLRTWLEIPTLSGLRRQLGEVQR
jgi:hypothetical protein